MASYHLFEAFPVLAARLPRLALGDLPTPVERLVEAGSYLSLPQLWIKRDDLSSGIYGGNKVRKLELLLAEALRLGKRSVVTAGAAGSNHVLATLLHARRLGLEGTALLLDQPNAAYVRRNLLGDLGSGARLVHVPSAAELPARLAWAMRGALLGGPPHPYLVTLGGSNPLSCLGYVNAALELAEQVNRKELPEPDLVFVAAGTLGTAAGLELGMRLAGMRSRVVAVAVVEKWACNAARWARMARRALGLMRTQGAPVPRIVIRPGELLMLHEMLGRRYAHFTHEGMEAVRVMRETERIKLDGTYTGKAFAGMLQVVRREGLSGKRILFWHTLSAASPDLAGVDYRKLPTPLRRYFEEPFQELEEES